jgi:dTDP-4-dehydrorhamnose 3,5-epimerase-like enzyme
MSSPDEQPRLIDIRVITDERGSISTAEAGAALPFTPQRYFTVFNVPPHQVRGEHAHRECHQFLVCLRGSVTARTDDGSYVEERKLDSPARGLYVPPMIWGGQFDFSSDAILLVLASHTYDPAEYIRDYEEFRRAVRRS